MTDWTPFQEMDPPLDMARIRRCAEIGGFSTAEVLTEVRRFNKGCRYYRNSLYEVRVHDSHVGGHMAINRLDHEPCRDWRHFQRIKNELLGPECEAVELYPSESRLRDIGNQYHLWFLPKGQKWAIGWSSRIAGEGLPGMKQRPLGE